MNPETEFTEQFLTYFFETFLQFTIQYISKFLSEKFIEESRDRKDNQTLYKLSQIIIQKLELFD